MASLHDAFSATLAYFDIHGGARWNKPIREKQPESFLGHLRSGTGFLHPTLLRMVQKMCNKYYVVLWWDRPPSATLCAFTYTQQTVDDFDSVLALRMQQEATGEVGSFNPPV